MQAEEAYKALSAGDPEMAIANYTLAIESNNLHPADLATSLLNRALAYQQVGQPLAAVEDYSRALKLDDLSAEQRYTAMYNRGLAQQKLGNLSSAVDDYTGALYLKPDFAHAYFARGNALRESGQNLFALSDFDKALRHNHPDKARVYFAQSQAFSALKRPTDELKALEMAAAANPQFQPAAQKLASHAGTAMAAPEPDPLLTASAAPIGGSVTLKKPELPKAIEPPAELAAQEAAQVAAAAEPNATVAAPKVVTAALAKPKKKYFDRILPESEQSAAASAPAVEKVVAIESADTGEADTATASIEPAAAPATEGQEASVEPKGTSQLTGWTVQVASAASEDAAWSTWKKMQARRSVLKGKTPAVVRADLGEKGIFYRVRFGGYDSQKSAQKACAKLKSNGVSCYVSLSNS